MRSTYYAVSRLVTQARGALWDRSESPGEMQVGLDVGCGPKKRTGFIGVDRYPARGVDVVCDLEHGILPFADATFDVVYSNHALEHVRNLDKVLAEISRVMKKGAKLQIGVPYAGDLRAFQDPTHERFFTLKTFEYFVKNGSRVGSWHTSKYFHRVSRRRLFFGAGPISVLTALIVNRHQALLDFYEGSFLRAIVPARDLHIELEK